MIDNSCCVYYGTYITTLSLSRMPAVIDLNRAETFTKNEAESFIGKTVKTVAGDVIINSIFCDGPDEYILLDDCGMFVYKSHNNCNYILD